MWRLIEPLWLGRATIKRPRDTDLRAVINALRYLVRAVCERRMLPNDHPPWQTVHYWFRRLLRRLLFATLHVLALLLDRMLVERAALPNSKFISSQSAMVPPAQKRGYDVCKTVKGRRRQIAVEINWWLTGSECDARHCGKLYAGVASARDLEAGMAGDRASV